MDLAREISSQFAHASSVELLPPYLLPPDGARGWVDVDGHLGIGSKVLAVAYVELCRAGAETASPEASLLALLATTENVHAVNARKRFCLSGAIAPAHELHTLDVLLSSHLYKHTKSPLLWSHRRWLLSTFAADVAPSLGHEWAVVSAAAVRHPRNYYAWAYMRWWCTHSDVFGSADDMRVLVDSTARLCRQHLSDVSMWTFLAWLDVPELNALAQRTSAEMPGHAAILASTTVPRPRRNLRA